VQGIADGGLAAGLLRLPTAREQLYVDSGWRFVRFAPQACRWFHRTPLRW